MSLAVEEEGLPCRVGEEGMGNGRWGPGETINT